MLLCYKKISAPLTRRTSLLSIADCPLKSITEFVHLTSASFSGAKIECSSICDLLIQMIGLSACQEGRCS
eukprot:scaffold7396_cov68-Skeletonema_marinoi.AAC.1